jgi:hypothetical protein
MSARRDDGQRRGETRRAAHQGERKRRLPQSLRALLAEAKRRRGLGALAGRTR